MVVVVVGVDLDWPEASPVVCDREDDFAVGAGMLMVVIVVAMGILEVVLGASPWGE